MSIGKHQIRLISRTKSYIKKISKGGVDTGKSALCYFAGWDESLGLCKLRLWVGDFAYFSFIRVFIREVWGIYNHFGYVIKNDLKIENFTNIIVTWGFKKNFLSNGSIQDHYLQTNSRETKNSLWFVIYFDKELPNKIDQKIIILQKKVNFFNYKIFAFFKNILLIFFRNNFNIIKIFHSLSSHAFFGQIIVKKINNYIEHKGLKSVIMPYEAQPFQQMIFSHAKKVNNKIKTIGYVHDAEPLHLHYNFRKGSPDLLLFHTKSRESYFAKHLNWPTKRLRHIPSLSFRKGANKEISSGVVLLPNGLYHKEKILLEFEKFLEISEKKSLSKLKIRCHPRSFNIKLQKKMESELKSLVGKYKNRFSSNLKKEKMLVVIGVSSAVVIALEKGMSVFHICTEPIIQSYSQEIWPDIYVKQITPNLFKYRLKKFGRCLTFGNEKRMFAKYCVN